MSSDFLRCVTVHHVTSRLLDVAFSGWGVFMMENYWQLFNTIQLYIAVRWFSMRVFWPLFVFFQSFEIFWLDHFFFSHWFSRQVSMKALRMSERQVCHLQELIFSGAGNFLGGRIRPSQHFMGWNIYEMRVETWTRFFSLWATYLSHIQWHLLDFQKKNI